MKAWRGHSFGPPENLIWEQVEDPPLSEGEVRIEIKASAVNFPDILFAAGTYQVKPPLPLVPGFEVAGVVCESREASLPVGTRVSTTLTGGGFATHAVSALPLVYAIPDAMGFEDAAALTLTYQTAWFALHRRAQLVAGEWVLIHAGAGGVGSAAIQLAKAAGAKVIATAGGEAKVLLCKQLGADVAVDYKSVDFVPVVKECTEGHGADVVFDPVGGDVFDKSTRCIAFEGRLIVIGFTSGRIPEARANHVLVKNYGVLGLHWGAYNLHNPSLVMHCQHELFRLHREGKIKPLISEALPMGQAPKALASVASRASTGKIVLLT